MPIIEHDHETLAARVESDEPLTKVEKIAIAYILRNSAIVKKKQSAGGAKSKGGGRPKKDPSEYSESYKKKLGIKG